MVLMSTNFKWPIHFTDDSITISLLASGKNTENEVGLSFIQHILTKNDYDISKHWFNILFYILPIAILMIAATGIIAITVMTVRDFFIEKDRREGYAGLAIISILLVVCAYMMFFFTHPSFFLYMPMLLVTLLLVIASDPFGGK
ncbi:hypothetical protein ACQKJC_22150 [Priestia koreensis]